jgi:cytochrome c biogenesis protein CcdA
MTLFLISFLAGMLTVLAPCILPILPVIIGGSMGDEKRRLAPFVIIASLGVSVILFTFLLKVSTAFITVPQSVWSSISGGILAAFGLIMVFPGIWETVAVKFRFGKSSNRFLAEGYKKKSFTGDVIMGMALGPIFSTCSPTYFVILATVLPQSFALGTAYLLAYVLGLSLVLVLIAILGQRFVGKLNGASDPRGRFKRGLGVLFLVIGILIITGIDKKIEANLIESGIFDSITGFENQLIEQNK